ncbi:BTAD domain-containing putative transcriptional regulator [Kitasatospora sp. NPDC127111]|uniref:AfsR/SARP family transcriptional regulator n=1 Tax=Kitasatospora sp. NPDC127111 TaxID=3345363 RepID=UPI003625AB51
MAGLRVSVLGPVRVRYGGRDVPAGSGQRQAVLAALALRAGRIVTADALVGLVWGESAPASVGAVVRNHVSKLRAAIGAAGGDAAAVLVSAGGGYVLHLADDGLDVTEFDRLAEAAGRHRERGEPADAVHRYREALALWTGSALSGVPGPDAERQRERLAGRRLAVLEDRLRLELGLGGHGRLVEELTALAAEHPLREGLRGLLMTALYRTGRQAEALEVFADARRVLAEEVGAEPGPGLRRLQRQILCADPGLAPPVPAGPPVPAAPATAAARPVPPAAPAIPAQLPPDVGDFTGRAAEIELIANALADAGRPGPAFVVVSGGVGVGKTTLAVRAARTVRGAFADGQLYAELGGSGREPAAPADVLAGFLRALGVPAEEIPGQAAERAERYRALLAGRRVLVVLDDARDEEQVRRLLPGDPASAVLVTARGRLSGLAGSPAVHLGRLTPEESVEFLSAVAGRSRIAAEPQAAADIAAACGRLPLALRVAATKLAARPAWSVAAVADRLRDERRRLAELRVGGLAVEAELRRGHRLLPDDLAAALPRLAALPVRSLPEAAAALGVPEPAAGLILERLAQAGMLDSPDRGRYAFHDLVRLFALHATPGPAA